jgi:hypothetical protein
MEQASLAEGYDFIFAFDVMEQMEDLLVCGSRLPAKKPKRLDPRARRFGREAQVRAAVPGSS